MKTIKFLLAIILLLTLSAVAKPVWAANDALLTQAARITATASRAAERQTTELANIQKTSDTMIADRLTSLNNLLSKVSGDTRLSDSDKATLTSNINTMISNLQALKAKIDADTDVTTARADRKTIVTSFHVYVTFEPQIRLLIVIGNLQTSATTIQNLIPQLQNLSTTLKNSGLDTSSMDAAIADMNTQLTNINSLLTTDKSKLQGIAISSSDNQATFVQIRQDMAKVRADFAQIRHDLATIKAAVTKTVKTAAASGTPVPTTVCIPRPACLSAQHPCTIAEPLHGWCPVTPTP